MSGHASYPTAGWVVALEGHPVDLAAWEHFLKPPYDPWCERIIGEPNILFLRSTALNNAADLKDASATGRALISRLNGAFRFVAESRTVTYGWLASSDGNGPLSKVIEVGPAEARFGTGFPTLATVGPNGRPVATPPTKPSYVQDLITRSESNEDVSDLLTFIGISESWFDIYKAFEVIKAIYKTESKVWEICRNLTDPLNPGSNNGILGAMKDLKQTANHYRHARGNPLPSNPPSMDEAVRLLKILAAAAI